MNILFIASSSDWHVDLWVQYFTKNNSVYLFSDKEDYLNNQEYESVKVIESNGLFGAILNFMKSKSHLLFQLNKLFSARKYGKDIDKLIIKYDIDIIHSHSLYYGYVASFIKSKVPVVFTPMGSDIILHAQTNFLYKYMAKQAFENSFVITSDSFLLQKRGINVGARTERNYVIQNGVDSRLFYPSDNDIKLKYSISDDEVLIFSPRAITYLYNIDTIILSLALLKDAGCKFKCMFSYAFGDEYFDGLVKIISENNLSEHIIWLGYLTYSEMAEHYKAADIVVSVPSSDSSPKSVYEAMFCKKPIIISDLEWSYELISESDCVLRVIARDEKQLFESFKKIINNHELADEISVNALSVAKKYFDYEDNMTRMENIMYEAVQNYSR